MGTLKAVDISEKEIFSLAQLDSEYTAYNNIMLVIAAYVAKKHHNNDLADELVRKCSNIVYAEMWNRWVKQKSKENNYEGGI